jgi:hypothetical protein
MGNREIMTMAGLWEAWKNPKDGQWLRSCTIITTEANDLMAPIHDRMPSTLSRRPPICGRAIAPGRASTRKRPGRRIRDGAVDGGRQCLSPGVRLAHPWSRSGTETPRQAAANRYTRAAGSTVRG